MFTAYCDESSRPLEEGGRPFVYTVGGYLFSALDVLDFDREWREVLADEGVSVFHMKDFAHSLNEFAGWACDEERRGNFLDRLCTIIKKYARHSLSYSVLLEDYERVDLKYMFHELLGEPYPLCALSCVVGMEEWMAANGFRSRPLYIFEDDAQNKKEFKRLMERAGKMEPWFEKKGDCSPLEAADFIAWEHTKFYAELAAGTFEKFRKSLASLREVPCSGNLFGAKELEDFCERHRIPLRSGGTQLFEAPMYKPRARKRALTPEEIEQRFNQQ